MKQMKMDRGTLQVNDFDNKMSLYKGGENIPLEEMLIDCLLDKVKIWINTDNGNYEFEGELKLRNKKGDNGFYVGKQNIQRILNENIGKNVEFLLMPMWEVKEKVKEIKQSQGNS